MLKATAQVDAQPPGPAVARSHGRHIACAALATVMVVVLAVTIDALSAPGSDPAPAKLAEWARDHGLGSAVSAAERWQYLASKPAVGGAPVGGIPRASAGPTIADAPTASLRNLTKGQALPGEGAWQTITAVAGRPALQVAYLRPDESHTSYLVAVLRIDPALVSGRLHPGTRDPGGSWPEATALTGWTRDHAVAAFNGGFRLTDSSDPGYYSDGRSVRPLVDGRASLVLYRDGHADVGAWSQSVRMTPNVVSVRQNLPLLVDGGRVNSACAAGGERKWGDTVGQNAYVDRSGFGVTADGQEIYVAGPALSVCSLGRVLTTAGVVRGMELDINPAWVSGAYFTPGRPGAHPVGHKLYPSEQPPADHYLTPSSRDWFSWTLRQ